MKTKYLLIGMVKLPESLVEVGTWWKTTNNRNNPFSTLDRIFTSKPLDMKISTLAKM